MERRRIADMNVENGGETEHSENGSEGEDGYSCASVLQQKACQCHPQWAHAEGNEPVCTIQAATKLVGSVRHAITHIHNADQGINDRNTAGDDGQQNQVHSDHVEQPQDDEQPGQTNDELAEAQTLLHLSSQHRTNNASNATDSENQADHNGAGVLVLG